MATNLSNYAQEGWHNSKTAVPYENPYVTSSSAWAAFEVGTWLQTTGRRYPSDKDVLASRGQRLRVHDMVVAIDINGNVERIS